MITEPPPLSLAPGCYGSALAYKPDTAACSTCVFRARCEPQHEINLRALRERFGIQPPKRRRSSPKRSVGNLAGQMTLSGAVLAMAEKIDGMNLGIVEKMKGMQNPFDGTKLNSMRVAAHVIMRGRGSLTEPMLVSAYTRALKMDDETAQKRARTAIQILSHVGAIDVREGFISVRRT